MVVRDRREVAADFRVQRERTQRPFARFQTPRGGHVRVLAASTAASTSNVDARERRISTLRCVIFWRKSDKFPADCACIGSYTEPMDVYRRGIDMTTLDRSNTL